MSKKITYLLGAGASAKALPLIKSIADTNARNKVDISNIDFLQGLPQELLKFANNITNDYQYIPRDSNQKTEPDELNSIAERCIEFGTPDLYAKYLLEKGDVLNYHQLKILISNYFIFKQGTGAFDIRALSFLTTISTNKSLPNEVGIISWNYDKQIEIAANRLRPQISSPLDSISNFASWPNIPNPNYNDKYFLVHLNGVAGFHYHANDLSVAFHDYWLFDHTKEPLLSFAWENENHIYKRTFTDNRLKLASKIASETTILVVIGYTFPFFNREIDNFIISEMKPTLEKIYFQDPFLDGQFLYDQFNLLKEDRELDKLKFYVNKPIIEKKFPIIHISNVDQYYVPYEL